MNLAPSLVCGPSVPPNTLSIGTVAAGPVAATLTGLAPHQVLNLTLPVGAAGVAVWVSGTTYSSLEVVAGSDGNVYQSVAGANSGHDPTTDDGTWWRLAYVAVATTLSVASGGRFTSLAGAVAFVASAVFGALVTISIGAGTFTSTSTVTLPKQAGANLALVGAGSASTTLQFNGCTGITVPTGCMGPDIRSLFVNGNSTAATVGVYVPRGGYLVSTTDLKVSAFATGVGVFGSGSLTSCVATGNTTYGLNCAGGDGVYALSCTFTGNGTSNVVTNYKGVAYLYTPTLGGTCTNGIQALSGGKVFVAVSVTQSSASGTSLYTVETGGQIYLGFAGPSSVTGYTNVYLADSVAWTFNVSSGKGSMVQTTDSGSAVKTITGTTTLLGHERNVVANLTGVSTITLPDPGGLPPGTVFSIRVTTANAHTIGSAVGTVNGSTVGASNPASYMCVALGAGMWSAVKL